QGAGRRSPTREARATRGLSTVTEYSVLGAGPASRSVGGALERQLTGGYAAQVWGLIVQRPGGSRAKEARCNSGRPGRAGGVRTRGGAANLECLVFQPLGRARPSGATLGGSPSDPGHLAGGRPQQVLGVAGDQPRLRGRVGAPCGRSRMWHLPVPDPEGGLG